MKFRLKLFASFRQIANTAEVEYILNEGATAEDLLNDIFDKNPSLIRMKGHVVVTINKQAAPLSTEIKEGDEVAILPPVSGG